MSEIIGFSIDEGFIPVKQGTVQMPEGNLNIEMNSLSKQGSYVIGELRFYASSNVSGRPILPSDFIPKSGTKIPVSIFASLGGGIVIGSYQDCSVNENGVINLGISSDVGYLIHFGYEAKQLY